MTKRMGKRSALLTVVVAAGIVSSGATLPEASADPFPGYGSHQIPLTDNNPALLGRSSWQPRPVDTVPVPRHPFMAPNGKSNTHINAFQTDATPFRGPVGKKTRVRSSFLGGESGTFTLDSRGRLVTIVIGSANNTLVVMNPATMDVISTYDFPPNAGTPNDLGGNPSTNTSGGAYFYLDNRDRAVTATKDGRIMAVRVAPDGKASLSRIVDVSGKLASGDQLHSTLPDWSGRIWFTTRHGVIGTITGFDSPHPQVRTLKVGEPIKKSFAADSDGSMSIVTDKALYRFAADASGTPSAQWRTVYPNDGVKKPGKLSAGAGSTPTLMDDRWVATTDNADPTNVVVYRRGPKSQGGGQEVCRVPVFRKGASASFQSLTWAGDQLVVENNYGYDGLASTLGGRSTVPGLAAIRFDKNTETCNIAWTNNQFSTPSAIPRLSLANGLLYTVTKPARADGADDWYLTALDWRTGKHVYSVRYGSGFPMNNNFTAVSLAPDGSAFVGVLGGLVRISDH